MASIYHNVTGSTGLDVELIAAGLNVASIGSIAITNTSSSVEASVSIKLFKDSDGSTFQMISNVAIPVGTTLILDDQSLLRFDNSRRGFGLFASVASDTVCDILINTA
mgnify:CR=1 FL=1|tara:strand:+ start:49 stop:372 length:324 start_codon:yes stop_codon:yes gene_type:complete